jgi:hypothetical protein
VCKVFFFCFFFLFLFFFSLCKIVTTSISACSRKVNGG